MKSKDFYKVPCDFQMRFRILSEEEHQVFQSVSMRPSPYSVLCSELDSLIESSKGLDMNRALIERAFQILINIDQRLERLEEDFHQFISGKKEEVQNYDWYHGELGAGGLVVQKSELKMEPSQAEAKLILVDLLLPSLPEHRIVATAKLNEIDQDKCIFEFQSIHKDDQEFIYRFVAARERELLRARASQKKSDE